MCRQYGVVTRQRHKNCIICQSHPVNAGTGSAADTDKAVLLVYCPELKQCLFSIGTSNRASGSAALDAAAFAGKQVHTYLAFISEDEQAASDSIYTGMVQL